MQDLKTGDTVRIMPHGSQKEWTKAKVQRKIAPRSYEVITEHNRSYRRNRRHLRHTTEHFTAQDRTDVSPLTEHYGQQDRQNIQQDLEETQTPNMA